MSTYKCSNLLDFGLRSTIFFLDLFSANQVNVHSYREHITLSNSLLLPLCCVIVGLTCPSAGYMMPDDANLCFVYFCVAAGEAPIKRMCPKGVRVPTWWTGGELNMCNVVNIVKHGGEPVCLRCAADDQKPLDSKLCCHQSQSGLCYVRCCCPVLD